MSAHPWLQHPGFWLFAALVAAWSLFWKGKALWRAARRGEKGWFVVLLVVNTAGILEIVYLYVLGGPERRGENTA